MGGTSTERDVSLASGRAVARGLREAGYGRVDEVVLERNEARPAPDVEAVFVALHGAYGEDGGVQHDLDLLGLPYVGSGAGASRRAFDKRETKAVLAREGLPTAPFRVLGPGEWEMPIKPPAVVKPPCQGSSAGVGWVFDDADWAKALAGARCYSDEVLVEAYIAGRELTVGIVDGKALPVIEVFAPRGRYDTEAKYTRGRSGYGVVSAEDPVARRCAGLALETFRAFDARGFGRVDFRVDGNARPFVLELNTIPGFTENSLLPKAAAAAGIDFATLCGEILELAVFDPPEG